MDLPPNKLKIEANGSRLSKLLINKGTQALKTTLHFNINFRSSNLSDELNKTSNKSTLESLRKRSVINKEQWDLLYPSTGLPNLENFDISLLTVLLRNICGLTAPHGGWDNLPSSSDSSISANIARIKFYRNKVYGHITTISVDDSEFEYWWQEVLKALVGLGIKQTEIDELKKAPLSSDEANYIEMLKEWYKADEQLIDVTEKIKEDVKVMNRYVVEMATKVANINEDVKKTKADVAGVKKMLQDKTYSVVEKLGKCNFNGLIKDLNKKYLKGTRQWLFEKLDTWLNDRSEDASNVMVLIAGPGVGKSVFAAELCRRYSEKKKLAASHFCRYNISDYRNPRKLIESLASSMCDTIPNFKNKLNEDLQRNHSKESITDEFIVLLNNPLHSLEDHEPMLLVIDALDESQVDGKSELLKLIAKEFDRLPKWIKIFITSRPELPIQTELKDMNPVEIETQPHDRKNKYDLGKYLAHELKSNFFIADSDDSNDRWHEDSDDSDDSNDRWHEDSDDSDDSNDRWHEDSDDSDDSNDRWHEDSDYSYVSFDSDNSLWTRIAAVAPHCIKMTCICHSLSLCVQHAFEKLPSSVGFLLAEIPKWFSKSAIRREAYKTLYEVMNPDDVQDVPFEKYSTTRWLVRGKVIFRILTNWFELQAYFRTAQPETTQAARFKARILLDMLNDPVLYLYFHFVSPLVTEFDRVNAFFQATDGDPEEMFTELNVHHKSLYGRVFDHQGKHLAIYEVDFGGKFLSEA
ncbi:uncharacterized protein LOC124451913 [Xenia sp. Carnegie-2017]|uniref:uncharacterized protein LOC124451913 n=1 Tax=Xenia sp. Carnegie-2017 TaxID=2897299 RepID=UPI001F048F6D|nr:uncharacterized protein LOC124451913 [Xenia sp. Carnegie-2017]XP_046858467.1 uncharacterized protein LOC124451913 [Xenia sp. Carnegie-2017]XP_046858468.1 uncharacterized protein LOC124451913 [Xenia sp. Carnegie-2017]